MTILSPNCHIVLERGYAISPGIPREDPIPIMVICNVKRVFFSESTIIISFTSPEAAWKAHDITGWPLTADHQLELQTAGDYITCRAPFTCEADTAYYARWYISTDLFPPSQSSH